MAITKKTLTSSKSAAKPTTKSVAASGPVASDKLISASRKTALRVTTAKKSAPAKAVHAMRIQSTRTINAKNIF